VLEYYTVKNPLNFFVELFEQPAWIPAWVTYLMIINMASLGFWHEPLAKLIFVTFMLSAMLMMGLYSRFGFTKILGMGHVLWVPLLVYIIVHIPVAEGVFQTYLGILATSIAASLILDAFDVSKYFSNRQRE
jgi:hypothetical protein